MDRGDRQRKILALLDKETGLSAGELAGRLQVSRMTVHRDLQSLYRQDLLLRIRGGAVAKGNPRSGLESYCTTCDRPVVPHQRSEFILEDGSSIVTCCAVCALRRVSHDNYEGDLLVGDQISGRMIPVDDAFFLVNSLASPCCQPSMLSFACEEEIALFQAGFGGSIARLNEALEFLRISERLNDR